MDDGIPSKIGRYEIDRLLGSGAMGFVFLGRDPELDRSVAIKTLRDLGMPKDALETFLERFRNEARAAARLHHPSIVQVYDVGQDDEMGPYLVFEYVPGATLKQIVRSRGPLDPRQLLRLAEHVGDALDTAHGEGIIHRDIKPDNLLVTDDGRTKLADFGVARVPDAALTREGQFLGTPCYAAPETLSEGDYGPRTDLFSFAAVLYESVSGTRAFPGDDAVAVAHKVIHDDPPPPSEVAKSGAVVPSEVDDVLLAGLSKDPEERYGSAAELADALREAFAVAGHAEREGREPSTSVVTRPPRVRPPTDAAPAEGGRWGFIAVLIGLLVVGVAVVFAFGGDALGGDDEPDAGLPYDAGRLVEPIEDPTPIRHDAGPTDGGDPLLSSRESDAGSSAVDAGGPPAGLSAHDREELAKDAIDQARDHLATRNLDAARRALAQARRYDRNNDDIDEVAAAIAAAER